MLLTHSKLSTSISYINFEKLTLLKQIIFYKPTQKNYEFYVCSQTDSISLNF